MLARIVPDFFKECPYNRKEIPMKTAAVYDIICVGAGPGNLALAEQVARSAFGSVLVLDMGLSVDKRYCPLAIDGKCPPCKICHAVHGVAGAGAYSDGKLSFFPAGSGLIHMAGGSGRLLDLDSQLREYFGSICRVACDATTIENSHSLRTQAQHSGIELKGYDVYHAGSEAIQEFYTAKINEIQALGVDFSTRSRVVDIEDCDNGLVVTWEKSGEKHQATCRKLSIGTGKASTVWLRKMLKKLRVETAPSSIDWGIRLEMPANLTKGIARCHRDAKFKVLMDDATEVRSFCFCQEGFVLGAYYRDMTTVSGYSLRDRHSENTNFAILNRTTLGKPDPFEFVLPFVQKQNAAAAGGVTIQTLGDFMLDKASSHESVKCADVVPTLGNAMPGRLDFDFCPGVRQNIIEFIRRLDDLCPGVSAPGNLVYGPVLEKCWDEVRLDGMLTTNPNVFVVGDASGHARGLVQAAGMGFLLAKWLSKSSSEVELLL
jgi:uncharacterized FAD-dependent dehydrogenase